ncbi:MAG: hypothetical protein ACI4IT_08565 [Oscillospiraceae bacterium]
MNEKKLTLLWATSLIVTGISAVVIFVALLADFELRDTVVRAAGLADSAAIPVLLVTTVKKTRKK